MKFKIIEIVHSGRKGTRYSPINNEKYYGLVDSIIEMKPLESLKSYEELKWNFVETKSGYEWWHTSVVICVSKHENDYLVETVNTIYALQKIGE